MSLTKSAYQVLKKEIEKQKNLFFGVKFEQIPRIENVEDQLCNLKNRKKQKAVLSHENYAFERKKRF